jgi:small subunit ribosomal protein S8
MAVASDPIADMLARIRNANLALHERVEMPASRVKTEIARLLKAEGFIKDFEVVAGPRGGVLRISLKYGQHRERVINGVQRVSRPGLRIYTPRNDIPKCLGGLGLVIMSTPKGIMSGRQAQRQRCGGEVMAFVW